MALRRMSSKSLVWGCVGGAVLPFCVDAQEAASQGIKLLNNNLTLSPYVNLEVAADSNINLDRKGGSGRKTYQGYQDDFVYRLNPGVDMTYLGNDWGAVGSAWYAYNWYQRHSDAKDSARWGERLRITRESPKGWALVLNEGYMESDTHDATYSTASGNGIWRNRTQLDASGMLSYAFSEQLSAALHLVYSDIWYGNYADEYYDLYGWNQWTFAGELAHRLTARSSVVLSAAYYEYYTDAKHMEFSDTSRGYTLQGGLMSRMTERIRYRALVGASAYDYGGDKAYAPSYTLDLSWVISHRLAATVAGGGYFQPSEREYTQRKMIYTLSAGATYKPMQRVLLTLDGIYYGEDNQNVAYRSSIYGDYSTDQFTVRLRASYQLQKYASMYCSAEYTCQESEIPKDDWDRYRLAVGLSFRY